MWNSTNLRTKFIIIVTRLLHCGCCIGVAYHYWPYLIFYFLKQRMAILPNVIHKTNL